MSATEAPVPKVTAATAELIADLNLLPKHFTETGVIERLVAQLTEKDLALTAAQRAIVAAPARTLDTDELVLLNDHLTAMLATLGWNADSEDDFDALNNLTHEVAEKQVAINAVIETFIVAQAAK